jgi:hypothetical protein
MTAEARKRQSLLGSRFGRLAVTSLVLVEYGKWGAVCQCDCGTITNPILVYQLRSGARKCCGCLVRERRASAKSPHVKTQVWRAWGSIRYRCSEKSQDYKYYAARGIKVCDRWQSFENFYADMGDPPPGCSIDRIDNDKGYEPGNCRWATAKEQAVNRCTTVLITFNGETHCIAEWASIKGMHKTLLRNRITRWGVERALTEPVGHWRTSVHA